MDRLEVAVVDTVGGMVDHLLLPSRSRRVVIAVDQPNDVELERPRIVHGDAEAEPLARPHRLAGGVADDRHGTA